MKKNAPSEMNELFEFPKTYDEQMADSLDANWDQTIGDLVSLEHKNEIFRRYSSPDRFYHTLTHIYQMINWANYFRYDLISFENVCRAIWYHDAVYSCGPNDERDSAKLFLSHFENSPLSEKEKAFVVNSIHKISWQSAKHNSFRF